MRLSSARLVLLIFLSAFSYIAKGADPQGYKVDIVSTGNGEMDATLKSSSDLSSLRTSAPVSPFGLIARARSDIDRLTTVLESYGYYQSAVAIKIGGTPLKDPGLRDILSALPKGSEPRVEVAFTLGPLYHLGRIDIDGELPEFARDTLGLRMGDAAVASTVLAGGARAVPRGGRPPTERAPGEGLCFREGGRAGRLRSGRCARARSLLSCGDGAARECRRHPYRGPETDARILAAKHAAAAYGRAVSDQRSRTRAARSARARRIRSSHRAARNRRRRVRGCAHHLQGTRAPAPCGDGERGVFQRPRRQRRRHVDGPQSVRQCGNVELGRARDRSGRQRYHGRGLRYQRQIFQAGFPAA